MEPLAKDGLDQREELLENDHYLNRNIYRILDKFWVWKKNAP